MTVQLLHFSDSGGGLSTLDNAPRLSAVMRALEREYPTRTLKLVSGDTLMPGVVGALAGDPSFAHIPAIGEPGNGRIDVAFLNRLGIHAASFGNHEFDAGTRELSEVLAAHGAWVGATFPYLAANLDFSANEDLRRLGLPSEPFVGSPSGPRAASNKLGADLVFLVEGEPIGVVGAVTPQLPSISAPGTVVTRPATPTDFDGLAALVQARVDALRARGVNKIVLLAHMQQHAIETDELPRRLDGVDVIIAGGNHGVWGDADDVPFKGDNKALAYPQWRASKTGEPVAVLNVGPEYKYVGRFLAAFDARGVLREGAYDPGRCGAFAADAAGVERLSAAPLVDAAMLAVAENGKAILVAKDGVTFGKTGVYLNGLRGALRTEETNLGDLTSDANLWAAQARDPRVAVSLGNGGGLRDSIGALGESLAFLPPAPNAAAGKRAGEISQLDIENSLRFNSELLLVTVTAAELRELLEHGVAASGPGVTPGRFPQVGGLELEVDLTRRAQTLGPDYRVTTVGERVRRLVLVDPKGAVTDTLVAEGALQGNPARRVRLVTFSYLEGGGDGYPYPRYRAENPFYERVSLDDTPGDQGFGDAGRQQHALTSYLVARFPKTGAGFAMADTPAGQDVRIRRLAP